MDAKQEEQLHRERVEVGGPYPAVTVIRCVDGGYIGPHGNGCEPPQYEPICVVHQNPEGDYETQPPSEAVAIAERLAACWNYCRGLPTAALDGEGVRAAIEEARRRFDVVKDTAYKLPNKCECSGSVACVACQLLGDIGDLGEALLRIDAALAAGEGR